MMTITSITQAAAGMSRVQQRLHEYQSTTRHAISPELKERLEQYGVSVHFSKEAEPFLAAPQFKPEKHPPIPLWSAVFKKLGLIDTMA
jgi:hypothetical protein